MRLLLAGSFLAFTATGCLVMPPPPSYDPAAVQRAQLGAQSQVDDHVSGRLDRARADAKKGGAREAIVFAKEVENTFHTGMNARGKVDGAALTNEAVGYLEAAAKANVADAPRLFAAKGSLLVTAGRKDDGQRALEDSLALTPNLWPVGKLLELYSEAGRAQDVTNVCKKVRPVVKTDEERYALLDQCLHWSHAASPEGGLAWAPKDDVGFYKQARAAEERKAQAENEAWRKKQEEDRERLQASFSKPEQGHGGGGHAGAGNAPPSGPVSVTIRSQCSKTVRVFYGSKPKFGSGTTSSVSSNSISSHSFQPGDQMWIVDEHDNGISNATVSSGTREIEVTSSCTGLVTR